MAFAEVCALFGFLFSIYCSYQLCVPPEKIQPVPTQYLGRWSFLTFQTNVICAIFYGGVLADMPAIAKHLYPLAFALGVFLTLAYYGLDHFQVDQVRRRRAWQREYPWVHWCAHFEHASALPLSLWYACTRDRALPVPTTFGKVVVVYYMAFYLILVHANKYATGVWVYPIFDDVTKAGGVFGRMAFIVVLCSVIVGLAYVGCWIAEARTLCFVEIGRYTLVLDWACAGGI